MLEFDGVGWRSVAWSMHAMRETIRSLRDRNFDPHGGGCMIGGNDFGSLAESLRDMGVLGPIECLNRIDALYTLEIDGHRAIPSESIPNLAIELFDLERRLEDEMKQHMFLSLSPRERQLFEQTEPLFGRNVDTNFPDAAFEIDEAGKCMAVGRYTAAAFHLMRSTEVGLRAAARCLGLPDPTKPAERNWGMVLDQSMKPEMERRSQRKGWQSPEDKQFFIEIFASADAIRSAWRNPTMHVERTYTEAEAEHVFYAVKGFMEKLADRMDQDGSPSA